METPIHAAPPVDLDRLVSRLCEKFGHNEIARILKELEEKAESYRNQTKSLSIAHDDEYDGG